MVNLAKAFQEIVERRRSVRIYDQDADFDSGVVSRSLQRAVLAPNSSNLQLWQFYHIKSKEAKETIAEYCLNQPSATTANELVVFVSRKDLFKERASWNLKKIEESFAKDNIEQTEVKNTRDTGDVLQNIGPNKQERLKSVQQYYGKLMPQLYNNDSLGLSSFMKDMYVKLFMAPKKPTYREVKKSDIDVIVHKSVALAAQTFMLSMAAEGYDTCPMEGIDSKRIKAFLELPNAAEVTMVVSCGKRKPEGIYGKRIRVPNENVIFEV